MSDEPGCLYLMFVLTRYERGNSLNLVCQVRGRGGVGKEVGWCGGLMVLLNMFLTLAVPLLSFKFTPTHLFQISLCLQGSNKNQKTRIVNKISCTEIPSERRHHSQIYSFLNRLTGAHL